MPDFQASLRRLMQADQDIQASELRAADMASRIAQRQARGEDVTQSVEVLTLMQASLECLRAHRALTLDAIAEARAANRNTHRERRLRA